MQAVVIGEGHLAWRQRPDPEPGDTEVVVAVRGAGLNGADMLQRRGRYPAPSGAPDDVPGMELAGEVVAVGRQVRAAAVGDRVMALVGGGAQATMAVADESHLLPVPDGIGWAAAGGFPEAYCTAHDALFTQCGLTVADRLLVTGAGGGVGVAAVQLAAAAGATVVASVRDPRRHEAVIALGATEVVEPRQQGDRGPYDVVLELVGASSLPSALQALATGARVSVIGVGGGAQLQLDLLGLMGRRARIGGSTLRGRTRAQKAAVVDRVRAHVLPLLATGRVTVPVCDTFAMPDAEAAYDRFEAGGKLGKVVLVA